MAKKRKEVDHWLSIARRDLDNARKNFTVEAYEVVAFLCHQSIEKGLKALYIHTRRKRPELTHSLVDLGTDLSVPAELMEPLRDMNPDYAVSRYPGAANGLPVDVYTKSKAASRLAVSQEFSIVPPLRDEGPA